MFLLGWGGYGCLYTPPRVSQLSLMRFGISDLDRVIFKLARTLVPRVPGVCV